MNMKHCRTVLLLGSLLFTLSGAAQKLGYLDTARKFPLYADPKYGGVTHYGVINDTPLNLSMVIDTFTTALQPFIRMADPAVNLSYLEGNRKVYLSTRIHKDSLSWFRYSITENDTVKRVVNAIPQHIDFVGLKESDFPDYAVVDLGAYETAGKKLVVKMYKLTDTGRVRTAIICNKPLSAARVTSVWVYNNGQRGRNIPVPETGERIITINDTTAGMVLCMDHTVDPELAVMYHVYLKDLNTERMMRLEQEWGREGNLLFFKIAGDYFSGAGNYEVLIVPGTKNLFAVKPFWDKAVKLQIIKTQIHKTISYKELAIIISCVIGGTMLFFFSLKRRQRLKLARERQQKELAQMKLSAVRQQLNPHFMFNALAGIQNLMNKQETDNANRYLGKFARITRHVLDNKELNSLAEEKSLLDDYLQMEQLRFGFQYTVDIAVQLDAANIEIPSMLLQPFVENAVIHGIAGLRDKGWITIRFVKNEKDLQIIIKDNGNGFDVQEPYKGLGLLLSKNRISLLNNVYGQASVLLDILSGEQGTTITITLKQWL
jgi:two-component sensor histidine kinase